MSGYEFTISNNQVTGMEWVSGSRTFTLPLPSDATFAVGSGTVTETITGSDASAVLQFTLDASNNNLYDLTGDTVTITNPTTTNANGSTFGYSFTTSNGEVTAVQAVASHGSNSSTHSLTIAPSASFAVSGGAITETLVQGNAVETIRFVQPSGSGLYAVASDSRSFIPADGASTLLSIDPFERAKFTFDANGNITQVQSVSPTGAVTTITPDSHTAFSQLAPGFVQETVTYGSHTAYEVFFDGSGAGTYTAVAHGSGSTVDLVGLHAQLAALPSALEVLV